MLVTGTRGSDTTTTDVNHFHRVFTTDIPICSPEHADWRKGEKAGIKVDQEEAKKRRASLVKNKSHHLRLIQTASSLSFDSKICGLVQDFLVNLITNNRVNSIPENDGHDGDFSPG